MRYASPFGVDHLDRFQRGRDVASFDIRDGHVGKSLNLAGRIFFDEIEGGIIFAGAHQKIH